MVSLLIAHGHPQTFTRLGCSRSETHLELTKDMALLAMLMPKELDYSYELMFGLEVGLLSMMYGGNSSWAHADCDERHKMCTFSGVMSSGMPILDPDESMAFAKAKASGATIEELPDSDDAAEGNGKAVKGKKKAKKNKGKKKSKKEKNGDVEEEKEEEQEEEIKYYNKRGKVVGSGPRQPMRFSGVIGPTHQTSKPSTAFPRD